MAKSAPTPKPSIYVSPNAPLSQDQIMAIANSQAKTAIAPQLASIDRAIQQNQMQGDAGVKTTAGYTQALLPEVANTGNHISDIYSGAANDVSSFAKGFSHGLQAIAQKQGDESSHALDLAGAPAAQQAQVQQQAGSAGGGQGLADLFYGNHGYLPATTLAQQGASFGAAASMLPSTFAGLGAEHAKQITQQTLAQGAQLGQNRITAAAALPNIQNQIMASLMKNELMKSHYGAQQDYWKGIIGARNDANQRQMLASLGQGIGPDGKLHTTLAAQVANDRSALGHSALNLATAKAQAQTTFQRDSLNDLNAYRKASIAATKAKTAVGAQTAQAKLVQAREVGITNGTAKVSDWLDKSLTGGGAKGGKKSVIGSQINLKTVTLPGGITQQQYLTKNGGYRNLPSGLGGVPPKDAQMTPVYGAPGQVDPKSLPPREQTLASVRTRLGVFLAPYHVTKEQINQVADHLVSNYYHDQAPQPSSDQSWNQQKDAAGPVTGGVVGPHGTIANPGVPGLDTSNYQPFPRG